MPKNDGSEQAELEQVVEFDVALLKAKLKNARAGATDAYNQLSDSLRLLGECQDLLEIIIDHKREDQIQALVKKIDEFKGD